MNQSNALPAKKPGVIPIIFLFVFLSCIALFSCFLTDESMIDVDYINQVKKYPTGCESVSTVMALNHVGIDITVDEFIDDYLPRAKNPRKNSKGKRVGSDPNEFFIGNPYTDEGYGCFAPVIKKAVEDLLKDKEIDSVYDVKQLDGYSVQRMCSSYVRKGVPVIFWASQKMKEVKDGMTWTISDTGEEFTWKTPMHCLLLVGYDSQNYYFNDPQTQKQQAYSRKDVEAAYDAMGKQAVVIIKK